MKKNSQIALLALPLLWGAGITQAEDTNAPGISIELSATQTENAGCRMSFLIQNHHAQDITDVVYETVLFGEKGQVAQMTLLDFQDLPAGRPRVRQFHISALICDKISRVLINGAERCAIDGQAAKSCDQGLELKSMTNIELIG